MNNETIQSLRNYALADKAKTTPRTDAATIPFDAKGCERDDRVPVSFARQLERELQQATADNSSLAERLTAAELERDRLGAELEELQGSHDLNQIASDALNDLRADLDRVTAELEHHKSVKETIDSAHKELSREHAALRARVNELEAQIERDAWTLSPEMVQTRNDQLAAKLEQAEQRSAELVAALTDLLECPTVTDRATCPNGDPSRIDEAPEWQAVLRIFCAWTRYKKLKALARAESATPDKQEVSP